MRTIFCVLDFQSIFLFVFSFSHRNLRITHLSFMTRLPWFFHLRFKIALFVFLNNVQFARNSVQIICFVSSRKFF